MDYEIWYLGDAATGRIEEIKVLKETEQKVKIVDRFNTGSSSTWYMNKTSVSQGSPHEWVRRDRDEVKRLLIVACEERLSEAEADVSYHRGILANAHAS